MPAVFPGGRTLASSPKLTVAQQAPTLLSPSDVGRVEARRGILSACLEGPCSGRPQEWSKFRHLGKQEPVGKSAKKLLLCRTILEPRTSQESKPSSPTGGGDFALVGLSLGVPRTRPGVRRDRRPALNAPRSATADQVQFPVCLGDHSRSRGIGLQLDLGRLRRGRALVDSDHVAIHPTVDPPS